MARTEFNKVLNKRSSVADKVPEDLTSIDYGELVVNYATGKEFIGIKSSDNEFVKFKAHNDAADISFNGEHSDSDFTGKTVETSIKQIEDVIVDNEEIVASSLNDLNTRVAANEESITGLTSSLSTKQDTLVSGTNIKTINGNSLLGSGNIVTTDIKTELSSPSETSVPSTNLLKTELDKKLNVEEQLLIKGNSWTESNPSYQLRGSQGIAIGDGAISLGGIAEGVDSFRVGSIWWTMTFTKLEDGKYQVVRSNNDENLMMSEKISIIKTIYKLINNLPDFNNPITINSAEYNSSTKKITVTCENDLTEGTYRIYNTSKGKHSISFLDGVAIGNGSTAVNAGLAIGEVSFASNIAISEGIGSFAEGNYSRTIGKYSHAEGKNTVANGEASHAEGGRTTANGNGSHSEGQQTVANGLVSHTEGNYTKTNNRAEHAEGQYNKSNQANTDQTASTFGNAGNTLHSVGMGTSEDTRKNANEIMQNGDHYVYGIGGYDGTNIDSAKTLQKVISETNDTISDLNASDIAFTKTNHVDTSFTGETVEAVLQEMETAMLDNELAISSGLNDLNDRIIAADDLYYKIRTVEKVLPDYIGYGTSGSTTAQSITLDANKFFVVGRTTGLTISLPSDSDFDCLEYCCQFYVPSDSFTLTVPSTVAWQDGTAPTFEANSCCQMVIVNNCATIGTYKQNS